MKILKKLLPVIIDIHVEPDDHYLTSKNTTDWLGFEKVVDLIRDVRQSHSQLKFSWLFRTDPQIRNVYGEGAWALKRYKKEIDEFETLGDEIGIHIHPYRFEAGESISQDFSDIDHLKVTVNEAVEAFKAVMKYTPSSISHTLGTTNTELVNHHRSLGLKYDLTLTIDSPVGLPKHLGDFVGERSGGTNFPKKVYCPSSSDYAKEDLNSSDYYMIPTQFWKIPAYVNLKNRIGRTIRKESLYVNAKLSLGMVPKRFRQVLKSSLQGKDYLVISSRSDIFKDNIKYSRAKENLEFLNGHTSIQFVTPESWIPSLNLKSNHNLV